MNKKQYAEYQKNVSEFFQKEGINNLSLESAELEPCFRWCACECCGSRLGGDRYRCTGYNPETEDIQAYEVCQDCLHYVTYGQLDDMSMMEIEKSAERRLTIAQTRARVVRAQHTTEDTNDEYPKPHQ